MFVASILIAQVWGLANAMLLCLPAFAVAFVGMVYAQLLGIRCPWCRGNLAPLGMQRGGLRCDPRVRFCPYCGRDLDGELLASLGRAGAEPRAQP